LIRKHSFHSPILSGASVEHLPHQTLSETPHNNTTKQPMAASVSQRWHDAARIGMGMVTPQPPPSSSGGGGGAADPNNPFLTPPRDDNPFLSSGTPKAAAGSSGGGHNPFLATTPPKGGVGTDGRRRGAVGVTNSTGSFTSSLLRGGGAGGLGASEQAAEVLGSLLEGASQVLCCAVLCCAVLCCAVLCCAVPCRAVLCCAVLCPFVCFLGVGGDHSTTHVP